MSAEQAVQNTCIHVSPAAYGAVHCAMPWDRMVLPCMLSSQTDLQKKLKPLEHVDID